MSVHCQAVKRGNQSQGNPKPNKGPEANVNFGTALCEMLPPKTEFARPAGNEFYSVQRSRERPLG